MLGRRGDKWLPWNARELSVRGADSAPPIACGEWKAGGARRTLQNKFPVITGCIHTMQFPRNRFTCILGCIHTTQFPRKRFTCISGCIHTTQFPRKRFTCISGCMHLRIARAVYTMHPEGFEDRMYHLIIYPVSNSIPVGKNFLCRSSFAVRSSSFEIVTEESRMHILVLR